MSDDLVQRLRKYAEWHTNVNNAEQRVPFGEPSLNVGEHISWKSADRIEALEEIIRQVNNTCSLYETANEMKEQRIEALEAQLNSQYEKILQECAEDYRRRDQRIEELEAALQEIITNSGTGWDKLHPIDIARRALEPKSE